MSVQHLMAIHSVAVEIFIHFRFIEFLINMRQDKTLNLIYILDTILLFVQYGHHYKVQQALIMITDNSS